jgi:predicted Mrr-cat superfamily restriction endonuclease
MSDIIQQITKCLTFIKDNVTGVDSVTDKLVEKGVLKLSERESIVSNTSPRERIQGILNMVTKRKKEDVFIVVLNETHNDHVAKEITSMEITTGKIL